jgi:hypothetical protein
MQCTACGTELAAPLETFGDLDAPMCQACHLGLMAEDDPYDRALFRYDDLGDGWLLKRLTEHGAEMLGGSAGEPVAKVNRAARSIVLFSPPARAGEGE